MCAISFTAYQKYAGKKARADEWVSRILDKLGIEKEYYRKHRTHASKDLGDDNKKFTKSLQKTFEEAEKLKYIP